jgi:hypothetical protein
METISNFVLFVAGLMCGILMLALIFKRSNQRQLLLISQLKKENEIKLSEQEKAYQFDIERTQKESDQERKRREEQKRSYFYKLVFYENTSPIELEIANEISKMGETAPNLHDFAQSSVDYLSKRLNLYHSALYWIDKSGDFVEIIAGTGEGGKRKMELKIKHLLRVDSNEEHLPFYNCIVFALTKNAVCFDVYEPPFNGIYYSYLPKDLQNNTIPPFSYFEMSDGFRSPSLPQTYQSLTIPLRTEERITGVLDIHASATDMGRKSAEILLPIANLIAKIGVNFEK